MEGISLDSLDLPELPDLPDLNAPAAEISAELGSAADAVSDTLGNTLTETAVNDTAADMVLDVEDYDLESLDVSSLISDMDGNAVEGASADIGNFNPDKLYVSKENRFHSMQAEQERAAVEEAKRREQELLDRANAIEKAGVAPEQRRYSSADYANENVGSYRYNENGTNKSLDSLYEQQFNVNSEIAEKGKHKVDLLTTIGIIYYGLGALLNVISFSLFGLIFNVAIVVLLVKLRQGSRKARELLGWACSINLFRALLNVGTVLFGGGLLSSLTGSASTGIFYVLQYLLTIAVSGFLAFMFFADDDIAEYTKISHENGVELSMNFFRMFRR